MWTMSAKAGSCATCACWGAVTTGGLCRECAVVRALARSGGRKRREANCRRCGWPEVVGPDGTCRSCLLAVRFGEDEAWLRSEIMRGDLAGGRPRQLVLRLPEVALPRASPLRDHERPLARPWRIYPWARPMLAKGQRDDEDVCPPQIPGQLALFRDHGRRFSSKHGGMIRDREIEDLPLVLDQLRIIADQRGVSSAGWFYDTWQGARLALASREPGERRVGAEMLADLPKMHPTIAEALKRAGLLRPARPRLVLASAFTRGSCEHCLAWNGVVRRVCAGCHHWERKPHHFPVSVCVRCCRELPTSAGHCRRCRLVMAETASDLSGAGMVGGDQLWFGGEFAPLLRTVKHKGTEVGVRGRFEAKAKAVREVAQPPREVSDHLIDPRQQGLFRCPERDWTRLDETRRPALTEHAMQVVAGFTSHLRSLGADPKQVASSFRTLRIVAGHLGVEVPLLEADIRAVAALSDSHHHARLPHYLQQLGLLEPLNLDSADVRHARELADALPTAFATAVHTWIRVMAGVGTRPSRALKDRTIHAYVSRAHPVLSDWASVGLEDPRAITSSDIDRAVSAQRGANTRATLCSLRSMFRALKRERLVFRDPARAVSLPGPNTLPRPLATDQLRGLLGQADTARDRLTVGLVAVHALTRFEVRHLLLTDIDLTRGRLTIRRPGCLDHTVYLDELTWDLLRTWLAERSTRWPSTTNPHLLLSRQTAVNDSNAALSDLSTKKPFMAIGVRASALRADRILDEAKHTADPIHLIRVFGIAPNTAMHYLRAAHPAQFRPDPIAP